jgi:hypothetical protein
MNMLSGTCRLPSPSQSQEPRDQVIVMTERQLDMSAWLLSAILMVIILAVAIYVFYLVIT